MNNVLPSKPYLPLKKLLSPFPIPVLPFSSKEGGRRKIILHALDLLFPIPFHRNLPTHSADATISGSAISNSTV